MTEDSFNGLITASTAALLISHIQFTKQIKGKWSVSH